MESQGSSYSLEITGCVRAAGQGFIECLYRLSLLSRKKDNRSCKYRLTKTSGLNYVLRPTRDAFGLGDRSES
jgi:hypothetical protein